MRAESASVIWTSSPHLSFDLRYCSHFLDEELELLGVVNTEAEIQTQACEVTQMPDTLPLPQMLYLGSDPSAVIGQ